MKKESIISSILNRASVFLFIATSLSTSCVNKDDVFNKNYNKELDLVVPEGFQWKTTKSVHISVNIKDDYSGKFNYIVNIYSEKPTEGSVPLCTGIGNQNMPFIADVTVPDTQKTLYIEQSLQKWDNTEESIGREITIEDGGSMDIDMTQSRSLSRVAAGSTETIPESLYPDNSKFDVVYTYKENDVPSSDLSKGTKIKVIVPSGKTLEYAEGSVMEELLGGERQGVDFCLILEPGASISGTKIKAGTDSKIFNDGAIHLTDEFKIGNNAVLYNNGCIYADHLNWEGTNADINFLNYSYLHVRKISLSQNCDMKLSTGSWIAADELNLDKGGNGNPIEINMHSNQDVIEGYKYKSLIQLGKITSDKNNATLNISSGILTEIQEKNISSDKGTVNIADRTDDAKGRIVIAGTSCSEGFGIEEKTFSLGEYDYAIEDMYPESGDYDMNDIVVQMSVTGTVNGGYINSVTVSGYLLAVGATKNITPYVQFDNISSSYLSETIEESVGKEHVVIQLFPEAHSFIGHSGIVNTKKDGVTVQKKEFSKTFKLKETSVPSTDLKLDDVNFFVIVDGKEIHLPEYASTDGTVTSYKKDGQIWGLRIPEYKYPLETTSIIDAYPKMKEWIRTSGAENKDWYSYPNTELVY